MRNLSMLLSCLLLLTFSSCEDTTFPSGQTVVEGQVVDAVSGDPVPFATLKLIASKSVSGAPIGGSDVKEKQIPVDENGRFELGFEHEEELRYRLEAHRKGLYGTSGSVSVSKGEMNGALEVEAGPFNWLKLNVINKERPEKVEKLVITGFSDPRSIRLENFSNDTSMVVKTNRADVSRDIHWIITNENVKEHEQSKEIYRPPLDTKEVKIPY